MSAPISFPFERNEFYAVSDLAKFLVALSEAQRETPEFSAAIRSRKLPWAKVWSEELLPIALLLQQHHTYAVQFRVMPEGHPVDVELRGNDGAVKQFQITLAFPDWDGESEDSRNPGYIAYLEREGVSQGGPVFLGGRISRSTSGRIESLPHARGDEVDLIAYERGLRKALQAKLLKEARHKRGVDVLLVYASNLRFRLNYADTASFVTPIVTGELKDFQELPFKKIIIVDNDPLGFVEFPTQTTLQYS